MSKILVTGGAGFIGSHLVDRLIEIGHEVDILDNLSTGKSKNINSKANYLNSEKFVNHDIRRDLDFTGYEYVFHLAAWPEVFISLEFPIASNENNLVGTMNVLEASKKAGVKRVIFASSSAVYGNQETPLREGFTVNPQNPYAVQKLTGELYCKLWNDLYDLPTISLRFFNVYGDRQDARSPYSGVIARFKQAQENGDKIQIYGDGMQTRDFVHVDDVVEALILALECPQTGVSINIGSGTATTIKDIANLFKCEVKHLPKRKEVGHSVADITLAKQLLKWSPKKTLKDYVHKNTT